MDIKDRIKELMEYEQLTAAAFAESIGVAQATISHTLGDRNKYPSTDFIMRLHERYKYINLNWLLTGNGEMLSDSNNLSSPDSDYPLFNDSPTANPTVESVAIELSTSTETGATKEMSQDETPCRAAKKITEIRVFFDDNTYEIFKPEK